MIELDDYRDFKECRTSLKMTSKDKNSSDAAQFMVESEESVVNFDSATKRYIQGCGINFTPVKSVDALMVRGEKVLFVEFKNGAADNIDKNSMQAKVVHSMLTFMAITTKTRDYLRKHAVLILVYNPKDSSVNKIKKILSKQAGEPLVHLGLGDFYPHVFGEVYTYTVKEFEEYLASK